jgi:hypothetical protein
MSTHDCHVDKLCNPSGIQSNHCGIQSNPCSMQLGSFIGPEKLNREYKEFRFNLILCPSIISEKKAKEIIETNNYEKLLYISVIVLNRYVNKYIPKYLVSFGNTSNIKNGEFYIGVSDYGEIIGIPVSDSLIENNYNRVKKMIMKCVKQTLIDNSEQVTQSILDKIQIDIIELNSEEELLNDNLDTMLDKYKKMNETYNTQDNETNETRLKWYDDLYYYKRAINELVNDPLVRSKIIEYVEKDTSDVSMDIKNNVIGILKVDVPIIYVRGEVPTRRDDITDVTYWIVNYRDMMCNEIMKKKPERHLLIKPDPPYYSIIRDYRPIVKRMSLSKINMIVIKITFPSKSIIDNWEQLSYTNKKITRYSVRSLDIHDNPCCI